MKTQEQIAAFLAEVWQVCEKHGLSISHEDYQGGFLIENISKQNHDWLFAAGNSTNEEQE